MSTRLSASCRPRERICGVACTDRTIELALSDDVVPSVAVMAVDGANVTVDRSATAKRLTTNARYRTGCGTVKRNTLTAGSEFCAGMMVGDPGICWPVAIHS